jgi:hypothetical protein
MASERMAVLCALAIGVSRNDGASALSALPSFGEGGSNRIRGVLLLRRILSLIVVVIYYTFIDSGWRLPVVKCKHRHQWPRNC